MNRRVRISIAVLIATVMLLAAIGIAYAMLSTGKKAPDFKLPALGGKSVSLSDLQNDPAKKGAKRVILMDFWATWCPPCRAEVPQLQKLHEKYAKKGLVVVGISVDSDGASSVGPFVKKNKVTYTVLLDQKHEAADKYQIRPIPTTYIIDKKGVIRAAHLGYSPGMEKDLEKEIQQLLK